MAKLAIKGHPTRGKKVIEILEMLGGITYYNLSGTQVLCAYYITDDKRVEWTDYQAFKDSLIFSLEAFEKKYPHKVGDKVCFPDDLSTPFTINKMWWDENANELLCSFIEDDIEVPVVGVRAYKEKETIKTIPPYMDYDVKADKGEEDIKKVAYLSINNKEYADEIEINLNDDYEYKFEMNRLYILKKKPFYPKTYEECWKILDAGEEEVVFDGATASEEVLLDSFIKLKRCRDAYWKIAGDWKPNLGEDFIYAIGTCYGAVEKRMVTGGSGILLFPTEEMRDAFYENFKDLIETCKEFL